MFLLLPLSHPGSPTAPPRRACHGYSRDMLTIPEIASSFALGRIAAIASRTKNHRAAREISMAAAEGQTSPKSSNEKSPDQKPSQEKASSGKAWHDIVLQTLKRNDIRLVPYVPDRVLTRLIQDLHADPFFTTFPTAREEEAVGILPRACIGGPRGAGPVPSSRRAPP